MKRLVLAISLLIGCSSCTKIKKGDCFIGGDETIRINRVREYGYDVDAWQREMPHNKLWWHYVRADFSSDVHQIDCLDYMDQ
jgi:hypothetical protein